MSKQSPYRTSNQSLMDERYFRFRDEILSKLDSNPEGYLDGAIEFNVVKGRIQHAHATTLDEGTRITDRFKLLGHIS